MRQVGSRRERGVVLVANGNLLREGALFNESVSRLSQSTFVPKGVYRFRSHESANQMVLLDGAAKDIEPTWFHEGENIRVADAFVVDLMLNANGQTYDTLPPLSGPMSHGLSAVMN